MHACLFISSMHSTTQHKQNQTPLFTTHQNIKMAQKMVTNFRRSLSFPDQPSNKATKPDKSRHVRSTSLPTQSYPIIPKIKHELSELDSWSAAEYSVRTSAWLCRGLDSLKSVHESLDDLLILPQTRESLRGSEHSSLIEKFLEDFLRFVDVYGTFQSLVLRMKEEYSSAQITVRRKDEAKIGAHCKNLRKITKEIGKLVYVIRSVRKFEAGPSFDDDAELIGVVNDLVRVTVSVSVAVFGRISRSFDLRSRTASYMGISFGRRMKSLVVEEGIQEFQEVDLENLSLRDGDLKMVAKKMHEVDDCMVKIEGCGNKVFRSLINTRVSLLNVLTQ